MNLILRRANPADAAAVAEVYLASRRAFLSYAPLAHTDAEVRQWLADVVIPSGKATVALDGTMIVGMMGLSEVGPHHWIEHLYVHPEFVGRGIGTELLNRAMETLRRPIRLYTYQANTGARRFYERHGFRPILLGDGSGNEEKCPDVLYELGDPEQVAAPAKAQIVAIYLSPAATVPPVAVAEAEACARRGLVGDRYFIGNGTFSDADPKGPGRELTLIESEVLALLESTGLSLTASEARRNLVTQGIRLNDLMGVKFRIGSVLAEGIRLCHPCTHLDKVTGKTLLKPLENKGGLRASILNDGVIRVGDAIELV